MDVLADILEAGDAITDVVDFGDGKQTKQPGSKQETGKQKVRPTDTQPGQPSHQQPGQQSGQQTQVPAFLVDFHTRVSQLLRQDTKYALLLAKIEETIKLPREYVFYACLVVLSCYLIFGGAARLVSSTLGFAVPAYYSMIAIRSANKDDDTQWLVYWTIFGIFSFFDGAAEAMYSYFPFYWVIKSFFLMWLWQENGALMLWNLHIGPLFDRFGSAERAPGPAGKGPGKRD